MELTCTPCDVGEIHDNCERKKETKYFSKKIQNIKSHRKVKHHPKIQEVDREENLEHTKKSISTNISSVKDICRFSCNICDFKSYYSVDVKNHMLSIHTEHLNTKVFKIGCKECEKGKAECMHGHRKAKKKMRQKNPFAYSVKFACNICGYNSVVSRYVKDHQKNVHFAEIGLKILKTGCRLCEQDVEHDRHMKTISVTRKKFKFICNKCDFKSNIPSHVKYHQIRCHKGDSSMKVLKIGCIHCKINAPHESHLRKHKKGTYKCSFQGCLFSSDKSISLTRHKDLMHLNIKKAACNLCDFDSYFS